MGKKYAIKLDGRKIGEWDEDDGPMGVAIGLAKAMFPTPKPKPKKKPRKDKGRA